MEGFNGFNKQSIFKFAKRAETPETLLAKDICVVRERSWDGDNVYLATKNVELAERFLTEVDGLSSIEYVALINAYNRGKAPENIFSESVISFHSISGQCYARVEELDISDMDIQVTALIELAHAYEYVVNKLKANEVLITYKTARGYKVVHTSLNQLKLSAWLGTSSLLEVMQVIKRFDNLNNIAEIVVPNLDAIEPSYEHINLMDIIEVQVVEE